MSARMDKYLREKAAQSPTIPLLKKDGSLRSLKEIEQDAIEHAMRLKRGCMENLAKSLGIGRSTLYRKIKEP